MANPIKTVVNLSIEDSPRGAYTKMLVIRVKNLYSTRTAFIRPQGADGLVLHYQSSGIRCHEETKTGLKRFEFDEGLVSFPLMKNVKPIQCAASMHGPNIVVDHLPAEIIGIQRYTERAAPENVPASGSPVRIMKEFPLRISVVKINNKPTFAIYFKGNEKTYSIQRLKLRTYGKDGLQAVRDDTGNKLTTNGARTDSKVVRFQGENLPAIIPSVRLRAFEYVAKWDEASDSLIMEDVLAVITERARGKKFDDVGPPRTKTESLNGENRVEKAIRLLKQKMTPVAVAKNTGLDLAFVESIRDESGLKDENQEKMDAIQAQLASLSKQLAALKK